MDQRPGLAEFTLTPLDSPAWVLSTPLERASEQRQSFARFHNGQAVKRIEKVNQVSESHSTAKLSALVEQKHRLLCDINRLVDSQAKSIEERRANELLPLLSAKQGLLDDLKQIEKQLNPFRHDEPDSRQWDSGEDRERCADLVTQNRVLLKQILDKEKQCEVILQQQREETRTRLNESEGSSHVLEAYSRNNTVAPARFDITSG